MAYDVFISFKNTAPGGGLTVDRTIAERLHMKLRDEGLEVFFSEKDLSTAAFMDEIYQALDEAKLLILVGSSVEYINSRWVKSEWSTFFGSIQSGRKENAHIITVLHGISTRDLPIQLEHFESFVSNDLDSAVDFAFRTLGKIKKTEAAARIAEEQERQRRVAEEAALIEMQRRMEAEQQAEREKAAAEEKRRRAMEAAELERRKRLDAEAKAAEAQANSKKQADKSRKLKIVAAVLAVVLVVGGVIGLEAYLRQQKLNSKLPGPITKADSLLDEIYDFEWIGDGFAITEYNRSERDIVLPDKYKGHPITSIGSDPLSPEEISGTGYGVSANNIVSLKYEAFWNSEALESVTISDSVKRIGACAFCNCRNLTSVTIPNSVSLIDIGAFAFCENLTSITIPGSVTDINSFAFNSCVRLETITISEGVTYIGDNAFQDCHRLKSLDIPNSVVGIGDYAFMNCTDLSTFTLGDGTIGIGDCAFWGCTSLKALTIPNSVEHIGNRAFEHCTITVTAPHKASYYGYSPNKGVTWIVE